LPCCTEAAIGQGGSGHVGDAAPLVTHELPLERYLERIELLEQKQAVKICVNLLSGANTEQQLDDVLGSAGWSLPSETRQRLDDVSAELSKVLD